MTIKREWLYSLELCVSWFLFAAVFYGCAVPRVVMEPADVQALIDDARDSVVLAQGAGAYELAPEQIARAESLLARAEEAAKEEKPGAEVVRMASEAKAKAEVAHAVSRQVKAHEKEVQRISSEKAREIAALESAQKAAEEAGGKEIEEVQACRKRIEQIEREKEKELATVRAALRVAEERADRIERELAVATSEWGTANEKLELARQEVQAYSGKIGRIERERKEELAAARASLRAAETDVQKAEARAKLYSERIAGIEKEREKEIAIHVAREETALKRAAETRAKKEVLRGKASLETLEKVRKAIEGWRIAWQRKDPDRYASYYADDAKIIKVVVVQGKEAVKELSKSEMREEMEEIFAQEIKFAMEELGLDAGSDAVRATFNFFKQVPAEAYEVEREVLKHNKWIKELLFREVQGEWKIVNENWTLYQDIPEYAKRR